MKQAEIFAETVIEIEKQRTLLLAIKNHQSNLLEEAKKGYLQVLDIDPKHCVALNNLSLMLDHDAALICLNTALEHDPNYIDALINVSNRYLEVDNLEMANLHIDKLSNLTENDGRVTELIKKFNARNPIDSFILKKNITSKSILMFTVIVPTHKRASLLERALSSIQNQTLNTCHEIIVVSDCIDKETEEVCQKWLRPSDTYIRRAGPSGPSESRNLALKIAKGQNVLFLDDDDAWHLNLLSSLADSETLKNGSPVYFNCTIIKESRSSGAPSFISESYLSTKNLINERIFVKNQVHMSCFATPINLLREITFDTHMRAYEDWDFLLFLFERAMPIHEEILGSKVHEVDDETTDRRGSSKAANDLNAVLDYMYVYRRHPVSPSLQQERAALLKSVGFNIDSNLL